MTYMGKPYYPAWLDNLADDVTGEGAAWDGARRAGLVGWDGREAAAEESPRRSDQGVP